MYTPLILDAIRCHCLSLRCPAGSHNWQYRSEWGSMVTGWSPFLSVFLMELAALIYCSPLLWPVTNALDWTFLGAILFLTQVIAEVSYKHPTESHLKIYTEFPLYSPLHDGLISPKCVKLLIGKTCVESKLILWVSNSAFKKALGEVNICRCTASLTM